MSPGKSTTVKSRMDGENIFKFINYDIHDFLSQQVCLFALLSHSNEVTVREQFGIIIMLECYNLKPQLSQH